MSEVPLGGAFPKARPSGLWIFCAVWYVVQGEPRGVFLQEKLTIEHIRIWSAANCKNQNVFRLVNIRTSARVQWMQEASRGIDDRLRHRI
jgi:hypothetical protein